MSSFDIYSKKATTIKSHSQNYNTAQESKKNANNQALKGVLLNHYIKKQYDETDNFTRISNQLLIPDEIKENQQTELKKNTPSFDIKKALKPLAVFTAASLGTIGILSLSIKNYSKIMANSNNLVRPPDLARNINIVEEPHFAMYRLLREPSTKNFIGFIGVGIMSAATLCAKNFVDGAKEIWVKKQNCDIEKDLQENLIEVETKSFSGKLQVVNNLLTQASEHFKEALKEPQSNNGFINFKKSLNFKGNESKKEETNNKKSTDKFISIAIGTIGFIALTYGIFKNFQKTVSNLETYTKKIEDTKIRQDIFKALQKNKDEAIEELVNILKSINASKAAIQENLSKIQGITQDEITKLTKEIQSSQIYAQAPEALGGISEKIQYYCYINEDRGHLYNWILNPENKFNKYLFLSFSTISSIGYIAKTCASAIKDVTVSRENSKSELALRKKLVEVEINNFKTKKLSAINPLIENFDRQVQKGKSKEELRDLAENILIEIKSGPPFVYS